MSVKSITRKITLSSNDWAYLELYAKAYDWESVLKGLEDSETLAVSETYCAMPVSVVKEITDAWAFDAVAVGVTPDVPPVSFPCCCDSVGFCVRHSGINIK